MAETFKAGKELIAALKVKAQGHRPGVFTYHLYGGVVDLLYPGGHLVDVRRREHLPDGTSVMIHADKERLDQLFSNLFENSLRYTDPGGQLVVRLTCKDRQTVIDFADSAPGVPEEELDRLFDRLYRVESSRSRSTGGAGLGLAICKNIVEAHDGTISAHSSPLGGVTIRVVLPMAVGCS